MTTRSSVAVKEKQKQPVCMPWIQCSGSASLVQLGWGRAFFLSQRHRNQIYGCSSALLQHDAVVYSSASSSWKQAEGEQLTRAGRGCSLEAAFFPPKAEQYVWDPAAAEETLSVRLQVDTRFARGGAHARADSLWWENSLSQAGCALSKARLRHPSGRSLTVPVEQVLCCCVCLHRPEEICPVAEWNKWKYWVLRGRGN